MPLARLSPLLWPRLQTCALRLAVSAAPRAAATPQLARSQHASAVRREAAKAKVPPAPASPLESSTARADLTRRRFWKSVALASAPLPGASAETASTLVVELDGRPLRTPEGTVLRIPRERVLLASLVAREWSEQEKVMKSWTLPMTSLAARALDGLATPEQRSAVCDDLVRYLRTDTVCFQEDHPPILVQLQHEHWDPLLAWVKERFGSTIVPITGLLGASQADDAVAPLRRHIDSYDAWELAAFERAVMATKSFVIALRLVEANRTSDGEQWGVEEASQAAEVEVKSQTEKWGMVDDTHDVDHEDLRARLGGCVLGLVRDSAEVADEVLSGQATQ
ncbi:ATP12-domain-containing protein [Tilletiopsis washingtonensis]|uniref:ATP12-domain-containing protein n=1 Tax=Tilletiopsis washingtonensis TaxID=58919 RepID=A0A316Z2E6_9BASI|nr:ATP12-domain-containing protein [Tilletiopsis washingtonensis]PWN95711.1 ATP12-domain-containing protein [Tilletiopsis washingtonensis]